MAGNGTIIRVSGISKSFYAGDNHSVEALKDVSMVVAAGEFLSVVGPTGCGKTTLLRIISGLEVPDHGSIEIATQDNPRRPSVHFMFQQHALFPWMTVERNVMFALSAAGWSRREILERCDECLRFVGLAASARSYPYELSGGMQRRAALARTIASRPEVVLMDEPFSALDIATARELYDEILNMHERLGMTIIFVTHNIEEAVFLASRVIIMATSPGRIIAEVPVDLSKPRDRLSDGFVGKMLQVREYFEKGSIG